LPGAAGQSGTSPRKLWTTGTLAYTSGGLVVLFFWLLWGDFAWSMRERSVGPMAQWYLSHLNVPSLVFGLLASSFPAVVSLVIGPVISVKSDRHRGARGRRIPFLLLTTPIAVFGMLGLALTPVLAHYVRTLMPGANEMLVSVVCFGVFWAAYELAFVASKAVFDGLVNDVVPREFLGRFYGLFRAISLIDGMIFNFWIMGRVPTHFTLILCVIAVFYGIAFTWVCLKVKEGRYPPPREPPPAAPGKGARGGFVFRFAAEIRTYCRECFTNSYYLLVFVMLMLGTASLAPLNVFQIPYANHLGVSMDLYGRCLSLVFLISLGLSFFLGWLCDVFHPLRVVMASLAGYACVMLAGGLYATTPASFLAVWVGHGVLAGCYFTSVASLGLRLFPHSRFAQFASAATMFTSLANMTIAPVIGTLIDATGKFYRLTFFSGLAASLLALVCGAFVYSRFMKLGGPKNYTAPE
jgi:MFS family permease